MKTNFHFYNNKSITIRDGKSSGVTMKDGTLLFQNSIRVIRNYNADKSKNIINKTNKNYKIKKKAVELSLIYAFFHYYFSSAIHIGHQSLKLQNAWHFYMSNYILGTRNHNCVINVDQTLDFLIRALYVIALVFRSKGNILIVNNNPDFSFVLKQAQNKFTSFKIAYSDNKWIGGLLTNWNRIIPSATKLIIFSHRFDNYIVRNNLHLPRYKKWKSCFQGFINLNFHFSKKPALIFIFNPNENKNILREAFHLKIPVAAITDSNTDLSLITYPIPANSQSIFFSWFCLNWILKIEKYFHLSLESPHEHH
jgi:small subunit ribosomal protein S2